MVLKKMNKKQADNFKKIEEIVCGYVMPIARVDGYPDTHWNDVKNILDEVVSKVGITKHRIVSDGDTITTIHSRIVNNLNVDDIIICDVSARNPNVMFELGMRIAFDKPVIIIKDSVTDYCFDSGTIEHLSYPKDLRYGAMQEFQSKLAGKIKAAFEKYIKNGDGDQSPILQNFGSIDKKDITLSKLSSEEILLQDIHSIKNTLVKLQMQSGTKRTWGGQNNNELISTWEVDKKFLSIPTTGYSLKQIEILKQLLSERDVNFVSTHDSVIITNFSKYKIELVNEVLKSINDHDEGESS